jgi:hypothetical protein
MQSLTTKFLLFIILPVILVLAALSLASYHLARNLLIDQMKISGSHFLRAADEPILVLWILPHAQRPTGFNIERTC